jgi:hypothetical protein
MNCEQCQDLLVEYALGELDRAECDGVERHLAGGCGVCRHELREMQEVVGMLGASLEEVAPAPHVRQELLARVAAEQRDATANAKVERAALPAQQAASDRRWQRTFAYAATLLCGFLIGALAMRQFAGSGVTIQSREAQLAEILDRARQNFGSPQIRFASLRSTADENAVVGHMMWDAMGRNLHVFAFDVEPPAANQQLAVWFVPAEGEPSYAGELKVSASGACAAVFAAPKFDEPVAQVVVTEERAGELQKPTGPQRIVSQFE